MTQKISERLTNAQNTPEYWDSLKYYLRVDLDEAWDDNDVAYWEWAAQCAQTHARARRLINNCLHDITFEQPEQVFRYMNFCAQHGLEIHENILGRCSAFSVAVVQEIVDQLSEQQLQDSERLAVYYAIKSDNTPLLRYYDTLFDFLDLQAQFQHLSELSPEIFDGCAHVLEPYILNKKLTEATQIYDTEQRVKKM